MKAKFIRLFSLIMIMALVITPVSAEQAVDQPVTPQREEVPAEIQELFAGGMSVEDFVQMTGTVPRALESFVESEALMIIELEGDPVGVHYAAQKAAGAEMATASVMALNQQLETAQATLIAQLPAGVRVIGQYTAAYNGIQVLMPLKDLPTIQGLPGVKSVHRAPIHTPALGASVDLIGASEVWEDFGYDGEGVVIAIVDTGIDYTHAALGGTGDPTHYSSNDPNFIDFTFPTEKVIGGFDFAGTDYDASGEVGSVIPQPDYDPLDENGHGTHVASTAAGLAIDDVSSGVAPAAKLIAYKVFGRDGSTSLVQNALDAAVWSYMMHGYPHVINMSLGSNFGSDDPNDPSVMATNNAAAAGIIVVASAGNAGDNSYITGSPASSSKAISVAASTTGYVTGPTINVEDTDDPNLTDIVYTPASFDDNTGHYTETTSAPLFYVGNLAGVLDNQLCTTDGIAAGALAGEIALIQRGGCTFSSKVNNAAALGAVGTILYNNIPGVFGGIGDPVLIPAAFIQMQDGIYLSAAHGETVVVDAKDDVKTVPDPYTPADSIATFSSRGPRGYDSALKPEITAPGVGIFAADMGSGISGVSYSGTSMAAPHIAGVAALMLQANPDLTPEQAKAAMMNTAVPLVDGTPIPRSGAGRVDAYRSVATEVIAIGNEDLVSLSWGVIMSRNDTVTREGEVTLFNSGDADLKYVANVDFQDGSYMTGATLTVEPEYVDVPAGGSASVTVTLELDMTQIPVLYGPAGLEEYFGFVSFEPYSLDIFLPIMLVDSMSSTEPVDEAGFVRSASAHHGNALVVPFYFQPRPYSQLEEILGDNVIDEPGDFSTTFEITHRGPIDSDLWVYPALIWNEEPDPTMYGPGDVRLFGMDFGGTSPYGDIISVAIDSWDYWHVPQPFFAEFDLYIDMNKDGVWDYVNFNYNYGAATGSGNNNTWVVLQVDLATGVLELGSPYLIYTDYNASYMEWYLPAAWQGLGRSDSTFGYWLLGFEEFGTSVNPPGQFDYFNSPFSWSFSNALGPATPETELTVSLDSPMGYYASQPLGVMIVDYNGDPRNNNGGQAYFEPITVDGIFGLTLLHTNDFHARVDEYNRNGARCTEATAAAGQCIAGAPRVAQVVDSMRLYNENVLVLDAGDQFQGTLFFTLFQGDVLNETMNYIGYDAMAVGNHEFDSGPATLADFINDSDFPVLSANIDASSDTDLMGLIPPYVILERGGQEIGVVGLTTPETENISSPGPDITFNDPVTSLQDAVDELTLMGVDKIIALTHQGYEQDLDLAEQVSGVDVIIGGHSHTFTYSPTDPIKFSPPEFPQYDPLAPAGEYPTVVESLTGEPVLVVTAYQWGTFLGNLSVIFDSDGLVQEFAGNPIFLGANIAKDSVLDEMLDPYRDAVADLVSQVVGETTVDLPILEGGLQICRLGECLLGNLVADAMLWKANEMEPGANYQIAFQNGGGLRAPILTGDITMGDVLETLPFGNTIATFELQGQYVKAALENGASRYPSANGGFAQVAGLRYVIDPTEPVGSRITSVDVWNGVGYDPLDLDEYYKVVTNDFMRRGGDNYTMFRDYAVDPYDFGPLLDEALADYLGDFSPVTPMIEGRVTFVP
jgi:2',3'-cyclic-nucleotide 2'-phosphodiesterase (5'-nucleotidase family)/subtilisin family serine protease